MPGQFSALLWAGTAGLIIARRVCLTGEARCVYRGGGVHSKIYGQHAVEREGGAVYCSCAAAVESYDT